MKKILFIILLLFSINVYAEELDMTFYKEVSTREELNEIDKYENLKELLIRDVNIDDISFVNHLSRLEKLNIFYSKVDLTKINNPNIKEVNIISSYIINDDLSHLANSNIKKLDLGGSYITSIYSLKNVISLEELSLDSITNLKSLEPITYLPNLKILNFNGSEDLIKAKVYNYILDHKIVGKNYDSSKYMYLNGEKYGKDLDDIISLTEKIYKEATDIANKELNINSSTRLGLSLNYSVFFYEIKKMKEEAIILAKTAFDEAMKILDDLEISKAKDTLLIIQMLKENLISWCNEINNEFES